MERMTLVVLGERSIQYCNMCGVKIMIAEVCNVCGVTRNGCGVQRTMSKTWDVCRVMRRIADVWSVNGVMQPAVCGVNGTVDKVYNVCRGKNATNVARTSSAVSRTIDEVLNVSGSVKTVTLVVLIIRSMEIETFLALTERFRHYESDGLSLECFWCKKITIDEVWNASCVYKTIDVIWITSGVKKTNEEGSVVSRTLERNDV